MLVSSIATDGRGRPTSTADGATAAWNADGELTSLSAPDGGIVAGWVAWEICGPCRRQLGPSLPFTRGPALPIDGPMGYDDVNLELLQHAGLTGPPHGSDVVPLHQTILDANASGVEVAVADLVRILGVFNVALNRPEDVGVRVLPTSLVYAVEECARLLRSAAWSTEEFALRCAWSAVLAGDIEDIVEHVRLETWAMTQSQTPGAAERRSRP